MTLVPAYGRDYTSGKAVKADFEANKDFMISDFFDKYDGKATNREDLIRAGVKSVNIRFKQLRNVVVIALPKK